jgi:hypothetical protein
MSGKYIVVSGYDEADFERQCSILLSEGWTPAGGLSVVLTPYVGLSYHQGFWKTWVD